jgi:Ca-activated chloride channel family protein
VFSILSPVVVLSQTSQKVAPDEPIRVHTVLLEVPVIVSGSDGRRVAGLRREDFSVFQGKQRLDVDFFADLEEPISVAILIDTSMSTLYSLKSIKKAANAFVKTLRDKDSATILSFDYEVRTLSKLTSDRHKWQNGIDGATTTNIPIEEAPKGVHGTMYDAIYRVATKDLGSGSGRKAVVILSDGFEGGTKVSFDELSSSLIGSDLTVYTIIFPTPGTVALFPPGTTSITREQFLDLPTIRAVHKFTEDTGGRLYLTMTDDLTSAIEAMSDELRKQYVIGFYPADSALSAAITINVAQKGAVVRTKKTIRLRQTDIH